MYERVLHIKAWKDATSPRRGRCSAGGFSKRRILRHDRAYLERFARETRRAERTHWAILALGPVFFAWNPWWLATAMVGYGVRRQRPVPPRAALQPRPPRAGARPRVGHAGAPHMFVPEA